VRLLSDKLRDLVAFRAPLASVEAVVAADLAKYGPLERVELKSLQDTISYLSPVSTAANRHVLGRLSSEWTMILNNGFHASGGLYRYSRNLGCVGIEAGWSPSGSVLIVMEAGRELRGITCIKNGNRWEFFARGSPLPFEELSFYAAKSERKRFPPELAARYVQRLTGIEWPPSWDLVFRDIVALEYPAPGHREHRVEPLVNDLA
jgi:hypothetical protein